MKKQTAVKKLDLKLIDIINQLPYDYNVKVELVRAFEQPFMDAYVDEESQMFMAIIETLDDPYQIRYKTGKSYFETNYENQIEILKQKAHEKKVKEKAHDIFETYKNKPNQKEFALTEVYGRMVAIQINSIQYRFLQEVRKEIENL
jgi:hypothetical protein